MTKHIWEVGEGPKKNVPNLPPIEKKFIYLLVNSFFWVVDWLISKWWQHLLIVQRLGLIGQYLRPDCTVFGASSLATLGLIGAALCQGGHLVSVPSMPRLFNLDKDCGAVQAEAGDVEDRL